MQVQIWHPAVEVGVGRVVEHAPEFLLVVGKLDQLRLMRGRRYRLFGQHLDLLDEALDVVISENRQTVCGGGEQGARTHPRVWLASVGVDAGRDHCLSSVCQKLDNGRAEPLGAKRHKVEGGVAATALLLDGRGWQGALKVREDVRVIGIVIHRCHHVRGRGLGAGENANVAVRPSCPHFGDEWLRRIVAKLFPLFHGIPMPRPVLGRSLAVWCDWQN